MPTRKPDLSEQFTIYLNSAGVPVQRPLGEMSWQEVLASAEWYQEATDRLKPWKPLSKQERDRLIERAVAAADGQLSPAAVVRLDTELKAIISAANHSAELNGKAGRLINLVLAAIPGWTNADSQMSLEEGLRRYWRQAA